MPNSLPLFAMPMSLSPRTLSFIILLNGLQGCSTLAVDVPLVYKIDIDQGNIIDQEMINKLRPNMTKRQVIYVLGSPLLIDTFHHNRWDYLYSQQDGSNDRTQQRISLRFNSTEQLINIEGDLAPEENPAPSPAKDITVDAPKRELKKTLYEMFTGLF